MSVLPKVSIIGLGAFGYALLRHWGVYHHQNMRLVGYDNSPELTKTLRETRHHPFFHQEHALHEAVGVVDSVAEAVLDADWLFLVIPSQHVRSAVGSALPYLSGKTKLVGTSKALDQQTGERLSVIVSQTLSITGHQIPYLFMAGGTAAGDLFDKGVLGATVAGYDQALVTQAAETFSTPQLRLKPSKDLIGVEYAAAFKNVISLMAGVLDGFNWSYGSKTYLLSIVSAEIEHLVVSELGGDPSTFRLNSQCWGNDMIMSATGETRNVSLGSLLAQGKSFEDAQAEMKAQKKSVESAQTLKQLHFLTSSTHQPVTHQLAYLILNNQVSEQKLFELISNT